MSVTAVALTTTFTPAASCTDLVFSAPIYKVWLNEPFPMSGSTLTDCYPSEFLAGYASVSPSSSIAPLMSPLVCPDGWTVAMRTSTDYMACCPTSYNFHAPDSMVDTDRPAYGGLCFSDITAGQTFTVTQYTDASVVQTQTITSTMNSGQAYAHLIDGIPMQAVLQKATSSPTSLAFDSSSVAAQASETATPSAGFIPIAPTPTPTFSPAAATNNAALSTGDVAGIAVGATGAVAAIAAIILFCWLRHRNKKQDDTPPPLPEKDYYPSNPSSVRSSPAPWDAPRSYATPSPLSSSSTQQPPYGYMRRQGGRPELAAPEEQVSEIYSSTRDEQNRGTLHVGMQMSDMGRQEYGADLSFYERNFEENRSARGSVHHSVREV